MSVYTELAEAELKNILSQYALGEYISHEGIAAGIENSNYFLDTTEGRFVLTVFERLDAKALPYFMRLMHTLAQRGFPCPSVQLRRDGSMLFAHAGKRACIVSCLPGSTVDVPDLRQLRPAGGMLARLHLAGQGFGERRENPTGVKWICSTGGALQPDMAARYGAGAAAMLGEELAWQQSQGARALPAGVIHADYFCDNILFSDDTVTGVIDFYYACDGAYAYDLAIAMNALAIDPESPDKGRLHALLDGYEQVRALAGEEKEALPQLLRLAATRFWVSRLYDALYPRKGAMVQIKAPEEYRQKLLWCRKYGI